jgi:hypothetical protein
MDNQQETNNYITYNLVGSSETTREAPNKYCLLPPALLPLARASLEAGAMLRCEKEAFLFFKLPLLPLLRRGRSLVFIIIFININKNASKRHASFASKRQEKNKNATSPKGSWR